jgi:hypothetical protein
MDLDREYIEQIAKFEKSLSEAVRVSSAAAGRDSPQPAFWASVLFTRICVTGVSLMSLVPRSRYFRTVKIHYDFAAVASITRNLWECYFVFFYLGVDKTDGDEWLTRLNVLQLHDCLSRHKLFSQLKSTKEYLAGFHVQAQDLRDKINSRAYFQALPEQRRAHILKGEHALLFSQDDLLKRMGEDVDLFRGLYRFLSFHVHSLPVAFYRIGEREQGRGVESEWEKKNIAIALDFARRPLVRATQEMRALFTDIP